MDTQRVGCDGRALVIEDDAAIRRLVEKILKRENFDVAMAADGREALEVLQSRPFDVIVLDLMIPEVDGFEIIEFMKSANMTTPVAVVSAVSQQALTRLDLDVVKVVISKPFDLDEFAKAIVGLCREARLS
jgi:DNA-binding response OmpR family regulator